MYRIVVSHDAQKSLQKIPKKFHQRIVRGLEKLAEDPHLGKSLKGELSGRYSLRIWPYRILYRVVEDRLLVQVIDIGHRQGIYG